jgi:CRISPR-associated endonuclease/helicase Cas3
MSGATVLGKPNQTLLGHLEDCLVVCDEVLMRRNAFLHKFCERFGWDWEEVRRLVRFAVWFHDVGKATEEWQRYIRNADGKGRITHALVSFALGLETLGVNPRKFLPDEKAASLLAILAHHEQLHDGAFREAAHRYPVHLHLDCVEEHFERFRSLEPSLTKNKWQSPILQLARAGQIVDRWKGQIAELGQDRVQFKILYSLMVSLLTACDGAASGLLSSEGSPDTPQTSSIASDTVKAGSNRFPFYNSSPLQALSFVKIPNELQRQVMAHEGERLILNAGCGEGKTAAALLFAQKLLKQNRIDRVIFTLPTKFTANNLFRDLTGTYGISRELIGITHGDSMEFLRQLSDEVQDANLVAQEFENTFYAKPITISTVDHLLMSLYHGHKFADRAFFHVASSLVVFDEVHYYQDTTLKAIAEAMRVLTRLGVPHVVMTATIPSPVRQRMNELQGYGERALSYPFLRVAANIAQSDEPKTPFVVMRHEEPLTTPDEPLAAEAFKHIAAHAHLRQIIFVNQVERAKRVYQALRDAHIGDNVICYHAGFISQHRWRKERLIRVLFTPSTQRANNDIIFLREAGFINSDACILVSTQVSELSLDISADLMHSEVSPVDSLAQRGGRLHRKGWRTTAPCGCERCRQRADIHGHEYAMHLYPLANWEKDCLPYDVDVLERSWDVLEDLYSFTAVCNWVDTVYPSCDSLTHVEMARAIQTDAVFGKQPQENFSNDPDEQGRIIIRESQYPTVEVVPLEFSEAVEANYRKHKTYHMVITQRAFWYAYRKGYIDQLQGKLYLCNRRGKRYEILVPFLRINAKYSFDLGLELEEFGVSNLL